MATSPVSRRTFLGTGACLAAAGLLGCQSERISRLVGQLGPTVAQRLGYPRNAKLVIIHADDIGFCHSVNRAAMTAFDRGAINSGSIMVPCPGFEEFAGWARARPGLDLGVHMTFVSERPAVRWGPILPPSEVPSLVDAQGYFPLQWTSERRPHPTEVEAELRAQIARARAQGITPTHLDSHQHFLQFQGPELFQTLVRVAREQRLPFRVAPAWYRRHPYLRRSRFHDTVVLDQRIEIRPGMAREDEWTQWYLKQIRALPTGLTEILVHPGYDDEELRHLTQDNPAWGAAWRQRDLDTVMSPDFAAALSEIGAVRITWRQLGPLSSA
jgi:hypothetical protein